MNKNKHIVVACSGGADSVVLAHLLKHGGFSISIAHCNFKLRAEESDKDADFVKKFAQKLDVQFYSVDFDTLAEVKKNKENIQLTARKLRYDWLNKLAIKKNACIALGHHQDDQVETFLIQLNRGGGLRGLCAMTVKNNNYLRPLLSKTKNWIITYAKANDLTWREDSSNHQNKYQRNLFRNVLLANNKGIGIQALELINNFKSLQKTVNTIAQKVTANWLASHVLLSWSKLPILIQKEVLFLLNISRNQSKEISKLEKSKVGSSIYLGKYELFCERNGIAIRSQEQPEPVLLLKPTAPENLIKPPSHNKFVVDAEKIKGTLSIRRRRSGDYFYPIGMQVRKIVSKYLTDKKTPAYLKKYAFVITDDEKIIAVQFGVVDNSVKINSQTQKYLSIEIKQK